MKKRPSSVIASCVIIILKVSGKRIPHSGQGKSPCLYVLYIIYISNGNNDAMTQSNRDGGFLRVIIRVVSASYSIMTHGAQPCLRHHSHTPAPHYSQTIPTLYAGVHL